LEALTEPGNVGEPCGISDTSTTPATTAVQIPRVIFRALSLLNALTRFRAMSRPEVAWT